MRGYLLLTYRDGVLGEGHFEISATHENIARFNFWPGMAVEIKKYVRSCLGCQENRTQRSLTQGLFQRFMINNPCERDGFDFIGPDARTWGGFRLIIIASDFFTNWIEAKSVSDIKAPKIASFIHLHFFRRLGAPRSVSSDQGTNLTSGIIRELMEQYGITHELTSGYRFQANGQMKCTIQTIKTVLKICVDNKERDVSSKCRLLI